MAAQTPTDKLRKLSRLDDGAIDLAAGALLLAGLERPEAELERYRRHLRRLVADVRNFVGTAVTGADENTGEPGPVDAHLFAEAVVQVLVRRYGYGGTAIAAETPAAANLMAVIDNRRGSATALCILVVHIARKLGLDASAILFPPRMLVAVQSGSERLLIDPFDECGLLDAPGLRAMIKAHHGDSTELRPHHTREAGNVATLLALQNEIKQHHLRAAATEAALATVERMLLLAPGTGALWREAGVLHARLDHLAEAVQALELFLTAPGADVHRYQASQLLQQLYDRLSE